MTQFPESSDNRSADTAQDGIIARTRMQLTELDAHVTRPAQAEHVTMESLMKDIRERKWDRMIKKVVLLLTGKGNDVRGLGFVTQNLDQIPDDKKSVLVNTVQSLDQKDMPWEKRLSTALLATQTRLHFYNKGYTEIADVRHRSVERVTGRDVTVLSLLEKNLGTAEGQKLWDDLKSGRIRGLLQVDGALPEGSYVYFDEQKRPIWIASTGTEKPVVSIFTKEKEEKPRSQIEFFQSIARIGDVLYVGPHPNDNAPLASAVNAGIRFIQSAQGGTGFFATHVLVVVEKDGLKQLAQLDEGREQPRFLPFDILPQKFGGVALGRLPMDAATAKKFSDSVVAVAPTLTYDHIKAAGVAIDASSSRTRKATNGNICTDLVAKQLTKAGIPGYNKNMTPHALFDTMPIVAAMDLNEVPTRKS
jgi:hypothetical protein